ncbi:hypothetical protein FE839_14690 [Klebsiella indica]|uniref:PucR family transcriptional regulator n=1 Tax=Klebsiella indica TaxID=2582917 RepID=A0A5R9LGS9_9ENTR|nr:PucR family transcriptional regulator [Klebsiella indica]TLV15644.1 hypothetical protein FE839_14690 [Klebsiella indica]
MFVIQDVLMIGSLNGIQIRAGASGFQRAVTTVTIMDIPEIADWLKGGEVVISGVLFEQCFSKEMVDTLLAKNVAGIITKEKFTLRISPDIFSWCDEVGFPIMLIPANYSWEEVMNPILNAIIRKPYHIIEESQKVHSLLMNAMIDGVSLPEMCCRFRSATGLSHAITDSDLYLIGASDDINWKNHTRELSINQLKPSALHMQTMDNTRIQTFCYWGKILSIPGKQLLFYPVILNHIKYGYIIILLDDNVVEIPADETVRIQQYGLFVALHVTKMSEISNATRRFNQLIMDRLLSEDKLSQHSIETMLAPTGKKIHRQYIVANLLYSNSDGIRSIELQNNRLNQFHDILKKQISNSDHIITFEKFNSQIVLIPWPNDALESLIADIRKLFILTTGYAKIYIGISEPVALKNIRMGFTQAQRTAQFLSSTASIVPYYKYQDLGVLRFFIDRQEYISGYFLKEMYETYIKPLLDYDKEHHSHLFDTLTTWINNDCSKTKTEKQLFIHKNTLIARFNTINKILNCNINKAEDLFNVQLAMKIHLALQLGHFDKSVI